MLKCSIIFHIHKTKGETNYAYVYNYMKNIKKVSFHIPQAAGGRPVFVSAKNCESFIFMYAQLNSIPNSSHNVTDSLFTDCNVSRYLYSFCKTLTF